MYIHTLMEINALVNLVWGWHIWDSQARANAVGFKWVSLPQRHFSVCSKALCWLDEPPTVPRVLFPPGGGDSSYPLWWLVSVINLTGLRRCLLGKCTTCHRGISRKDCMWHGDWGERPNLNVGSRLQWAARWDKDVDQGGVCSWKPSASLSGYAYCCCLQPPSLAFQHKSDDSDTLGKLPGIQAWVGAAWA